MPNSQTDYLPYILLAVIVLVGGLVAFVADSMGRRIGKKRLSFMGLRPRYTATLIIVLAGLLIPLLTIFAIYALSSDARDWIRKGRQAIVESQHLQAQIDKQKDEIRLQNINKKELTDQLKRQFDQLRLVRDTLTKANAEAAKAQKTVVIAQAKVKSLEGLIAASSRQIAAKEKELRSTQSQLKQNKVALAKQQQLLAQSKSTLKEATGQLNEAQKYGLELDHKNKELEGKIDDLNKNLEGLKQQKAQFETQVEGLKESVTIYQGSIRDLTSRINELQTQRDQLGNYLENSMQRIQVSRTKPLIFDKDEELARIQLPPSLSPVAARNAYFDLLQRARSVAIERKANPGPNSAGFSGPKSIESQEQEIIHALMSQRYEQVFTARSLVNSFQGEYVVLAFSVYPNRVVYTPGKLIAETKIDGRKSEVEILNAITQFIQVDLRAKALADGMIPPSGRSGTLGVVSNDEMLNLINQIKETNVVIRLQALAKDETKAGDQIELTFRIRY